MAFRPQLRDSVRDALDEIKDEEEYSNYDRAVTHALREAGYDI